MLKGEQTFLLPIALKHFCRVSIVPIGLHDSLSALLQALVFL